MSNVISTENTFTVWEALNEPTEAVIADLKASIETLKAENATFLSEITQLKSDITSLTADDVKTAAAINTINTTLTDHSNLINTNKTNIASLDVRVTALEKSSV
jgi:chromosome segregation ATPase